MASERVGFYVRLPAKQVAQLDRAADQAGMKKQEYVSRLLGERVLSNTNSTRSNPAPTTPSADANPILSLNEAASFLRVSEAALLTRAERGEIPGRSFDGEWRFSRDAILQWLSGSDRTISAGFVGTTSKSKG